MKAIHEFFVDKPEHVIHLPTAQALVINIERYPTEGAAEHVAVAGSVPSDSPGAV
jgi:hypothetical protein